MEQIPISTDMGCVSVTVVLDGKVLTVQLNWNEFGQYWSMFIWDSDDTLLVGGIKLVPMYPLTFRYKAITGMPSGYFYLHRAYFLKALPDYDTPRTEDFVLLYATKDELDAIGLGNVIQ